MRYIRWILFLCFLICFAGCAAPAKSEESIWRVTAEDFAPASDWPENDYTAQILKPESGQVEYINDWSSEGKFGVWLKDISREESNRYVEQLKDKGYQEISQAENSVSVGTMLWKNEIYLSIAYSDDSLGILIMTEQGR
ncbi:MAG: hypothetical protein ACLU6B_09965 [Lachnospirales bacterium]